MYRVVTTQESQTNKTKSALSSTGMNATSRVRRPMSRDSHVAHSVLDNSKKAAKNVSVYVRKNKQKDNTSANVISNKENVIDVDVANASKAKTLLCVSCMQNVLIPCHDKCSSDRSVGCSKHMTGNRSILRNFIEKFMGTVRFGNDNFAAITGYGDYIHDNITICHVYYVEGLGHNLFSVGQFCDGDLEVAFRSNTCYVRNIEGDDLLTVKSKQASVHLNLVPSDHSNLELLHMAFLCGSNEGSSINGKKYILVIVDDFSGYTWVYFLRSKDKTPEIIKKFIAQAQLNYKAKVCKISIDMADAFDQEDTANFDGNAQFVPYNPPSHEEIESSTTALEPSNVHNFHQVQPSHLDNRSSSRPNLRYAMYALTVSTIKPKNIKEAMADHSWIDSMQDELNQFERLQVWELIPRPEGLQVHQSPRGIFISQSQYAIELLKKHGLDECVSMSTPMATERLDADLQGTPTDQMTYRRMIGGLMYLTASRLDIAFATFDSRFELIAYSDANHAGCKDNCKSTSGGLQFLGGKLVSWSSKKQDCTAMSTAEAEYVSLSACCAQVIWMRTQLLDYGYKYNRIPMYCDSKSAIAISCNPVQHSKTKHIDIRYHFIKEHVEKGTVEIYFVGTEYQLADLFTKALPKERFEYLVHRIGMRCMTPTQLESLTKLSS
ncbi:retrovirus-related pol polyprotein from transposon TNT 1-94 [Tanacetum coccineum]